MTAAMAASVWSRAMAAAIPPHASRLALFDAQATRPALAAIDLWDMWPVADAAGSTLVRHGRQWWFFLAVERAPGPEARHDGARIHLVSDGDGGWRDHGPAFAADAMPGSREWSGSALLASDGTTLTMFLTAAGDREGGPHFRQRLFETTGRLTISEDGARCDGWSEPAEIVAADGRWYAPADQAAPEQGTIRGFRDPGYFRDPRGGAEFVTFTANRADCVDPASGVVGWARRDAGGWTLLPPLLDATGTNSELERPHIVARGGRYYLFWSTQRRRFAAGVDAPTGLYAMVADGVAGPWRPVNGTGLVAGNPESAPYQAYCWWVTGEGDVLSFIDYHGTDDPHTASIADRRARFGGTPAPFFRLRFEGDRVTIA